VDLIRQFWNRKNVKLYNKYLNDLIDDNRVDDYKRDNKKLIIINNLIPSLLKNVSESQESSKQIAKRLYNESPKNVIFLNSNVFSLFRVSNDEKTG